MKAIKAKAKKYESKKYLKGNVTLPKKKKK